MIHSQTCSEGLGTDSKVQAKEKLDAASPALRMRPVRGHYLASLFQSISSSERKLTSRDKSVLRLVAQGMTNPRHLAFPPE